MNGNNSQLSIEQRALIARKKKQAILRRQARFKESQARYHAYQSLGKQPAGIAEQMRKKKDFIAKQAAEKREKEKAKAMKEAMEEAKAIKESQNAALLKQAEEAQFAKDMQMAFAMSVQCDMDQVDDVELLNNKNNKNKNYNYGSQQFVALSEPKAVQTLAQIVDNLSTEEKAIFDGCRPFIDALLTETLHELGFRL